MIYDQMFSLQSVLHIATHLSTFCIMLLECGTCFAFPSYLRPIFLCFNLSAIIFKTIKHFSYCHTSLSTHEIMFLLTSLSVLCLKIFIKLPASISYRKKLRPLGLASYTSSVWWRHWFCSLIPFILTTPVQTPYTPPNITSIYLGTLHFPCTLPKSASLHLPTQSLVNVQGSGPLFPWNFDDLPKPISFYSLDSISHLYFCYERLQTPLGPITKETIIFLNVSITYNFKT